MSVTTDTKILDKIVAQLNPRTAEAVKETAFIVQAKSAIAAPYDTGALSIGITAEPQSAYEWIVRDSVNYGIHQEFGTYKMGAQPFMIPSVESERQAFNQRMSGVVKP